MLYIYLLMYMGYKLTYHSNGRPAGSYRVGLQTRTSESTAMCSMYMCDDLRTAGSISIAMYIN